MKTDLDLTPLSGKCWKATITEAAKVLFIISTLSLKCHLKHRKP